MRTFIVFFIAALAIILLLILFKYLRLWYWLRQERKRQEILQKLQERHPVSDLDEIIHLQWDYQPKKKEKK